MGDRATCRHYHAAGKPCAAGVDVEQLRDVELRLPCIVIRGVAGAVACDLRELPANDQVVELGRMGRALELVVAGRCPFCGEPVESERVLGGRVIAVPCKHVLRSIA
jgi:hypothetical protein